MRPAFADPHAEVETRRYARMTPEARLELFLQLCDLTDELQRGRPDCKALRAPTPRSPEAIAVWERPMARR
jgi:hypothetical protein